MSYLDSELYKESVLVIDGYRKEIKRAAAELRHACEIYEPADFVCMRAHVCIVLEQLEKAVP